MLNRMLGAARLNVDTFEEVEHDRSATVQALLVVVIVAVVSGVGGVLSKDASVVDGVLLGVVRGAVSWAVWALVAWMVGTTILRTRQTEADWGQLTRTTGFAQTPGILAVLIFIPVVGGIIGLAVFIWQLAAMVIAVRQSLDYTSSLRAFFVVLIALIPVLIINGVIFAVLGLFPGG